MIRFSVEGMRCGGCAGAVKDAIRSVDPHAKIEIDIGAKEISLASAAEAGRLRQAIAEAGYQARELA